MTNNFILRNISIKWIKPLKYNLRLLSQQYIHIEESLLIESFYESYNDIAIITKKYSYSWSNYIITALSMISLRIPLSIIFILYEKNFYEIPTFLFQSINWLVLMYSICQLNEENNKLIRYLYRSRLFNHLTIIDFEKYNIYKKIGLNLFNLYPTFTEFNRLILILGNFIIPVILAGINMIFN